MKSAITMIMGLALASVGTVAAARTPSSQLSFTSHGIGPVSVGQVQSNQKALAESYYAKGKGTANLVRSKCDLRAIKGSDNSYAWIIDNRVALTGTADPAVALPSGLKVGMTSADMTRLEPDLKPGANIEGVDITSDIQQYYADLSNGNRMRVTLEDKEVVEIAVGKKVDAPVTC